MIAIVTVLAWALGAPQSGRTMAVTFDDLPVSRSSMPLAAQESVTVALLGALSRHRVPAIGFVNEVKLRRDIPATPSSEARVPVVPGTEYPVPGTPDSRPGTLSDTPDAARTRLLELWLDAGMDLGNHTFAHPDLHHTPVESYLREIERGDEVTRSLMRARGGAPRWFRHPFLHTGRSLAVRDSVSRYLERRGYQVAPVTMDNGDYLFARAYDLAREREDRPAMARLDTEYLTYMEQVIAFYEAQARAILGREIPQVLLLHASALNAATFDRLATWLERRGYRMIPIAEAVADSAYRSADHYTGPAGIGWIHRWAITRGVPPSVFRGEPEVPAWVAQAAQP